MAPYLEDGLDTGVRLQQKELSPFLPADLYVAVLVHPGGRGGGDVGGRSEGKQTPIIGAHKSV